MLNKIETSSGLHRVFIGSSSGHHRMLKLPNDFDPDIYLELHADVKSAGVDPGRHYLEFGINEGRAYKRQGGLENVLAKFLTIRPMNKNAFDVFAKSWSTIFDGMTQGHFDGTRDARIVWSLQKVNVEGFRILELGPLEAAHTWMLEKQG